MTDYGIDVSHWNTVQDWNAVRGNNITFVSFKLTEGTGYLDPTSGPRVPPARAAGIVPGGYHFAQPGDPTAQARHFAGQLRACGLLDGGSLAPMLDMEAAGLRANANPFVRGFIAELRQQTGIRRVLVYANLDWWRSTLRPDEWADDDVLLWIARYNGDPGNPGWTHPKLALHQHTQSGTVPGVAGHVDRNATIGGFSLANLTLDGTTPPPLPQSPATPPATYTVQPGDTLSEIAARFGTTVPILASLNGIADPNRIYPGNVLRLSDGVQLPVRRYQIQRGDTLSGIARRFGTTVPALAARNHIGDPNKIQAGAWLDLP